MKDELRLSFKPRARLMLQLGDQLIRNERIALFELVKNAYDADASFARITMNQVDDLDEGQIIVEDNGTGMDLNTIENVWMQPGTEKRKKQLDSGKRTPKFKRLPIGEKGIGRFAVHKLGDVIEVITRRKGHPEITVNIDWRKFQEDKDLSRVKIIVRQREPRVFTQNTTGTKISVTKLRTAWERGMIRHAYRAITSIVNPFQFGKAQFQVEMKCPDKPDVLDGMIDPRHVQELALWHAECVLDEAKFTMNFKFAPWPTMERKLEGRMEIIESDILDPDEKKPVPINLSKCGIGKLRMEMFAYDRDSSILNLLIGNKTQFKNFLDNNGGIRVYRDEIRVYDYGERGNDWLDLDLRRVNIPTQRLSNNIVIGAVFLERAASKDLVEKTNREGFIENEAYALFRKAVLYAITQFESERYVDKSNLRVLFGPSKGTEPVYETFDLLRKTIKRKIGDVKLKRELISYIDRAEHEYNEIRNTLLKSSGAGLSLSIVIHEFEIIVNNLVNIVDREKSSERISGLVKHLVDLIEGFTALVRSDTKKKQDLKAILDQALFNIEFRLIAHGIEIIDRFSDAKCNTRVLCSRNYILMVLMNILDNSIWWLARKYQKRTNMKRIYLTITNAIEGGVAIVVADNGPGFTIPTEYAIKPFVTKKPSGMGLGLYIADEIMKAHKGELLFPEKGDVKLPKGIDGAIVALLFREGVR